MKIITERERDWVELTARSIGSPYGKLLAIAEDWATKMEETTPLCVDYGMDLDAAIEGHDVTAGDIAEMVVVLSNFWVHGDELLEHLTLIETLLVRENIEFRVGNLVKQAQELGKDDSISENPA